MKKLYAVILFLFVSSVAFSQQFGNEWINYSQKYYAVKIIQNGVYRLDSSTLSNAGIDLSVVKPQNLQIFGRQQEQAIYISGESDSVFNASDYLEFLAFKNDGWLDTILYGGTQNMNDYYYSLYNDTATYYITFNNSFANKRVSLNVDTNYSLYTAQPYCYVESVLKFFNEYNVGAQLSGASESRFVPGEGWTSYKLQGIDPSNPGLGFTFTTNVNTPLLYTGIGAPNAIIQANAVSSSNAAYDPSLVAGNHHLRIKYGASNTVIKDTIFKEYYMVKKKVSVPASTLTTGVTPVRYEIVDDLNVASDIISVASSVISYPRIPSMGSVNDLTFTVPFNGIDPQTRYTISSFSGTTPHVYIIGDSVWRTTGSLSGGILDFLVPDNASGKSQQCHVYTSSNLITSIQPVNGTGDFVDYGSMMIGDAYIILTHPKLASKAQLYANYRSSVPGGAHNTVVVNINELYHQFAAGINKHSIAARRFCDYVINTWPSKPRYLFIIGKGVREASEGASSSLSGTRQDVDKYAECMVPSFGYPCSDNRITAGLDGTFLEPAIPTGRLAATADDEDSMQIQQYLDKMIEYEQAQQLNLYTKDEKDWMKHVLEFGGGANDTEQGWFQGFLNNYKATLEDTLFAGEVNTFFKTSSAPIDPVDFQEINDRVDDGVSLMIFFGHGSINGFDTNIDDVTNWQNQGKYPLLIANSCFTGDIHQPGTASVSENFTMIPDKGVIGFLSTVKQGFVYQLNQYTDRLTREISQYSYGESIGEQMQRAVSYLNSTVTSTTPVNDVADEEVYTGMTLHGDPALKLNAHAYPELVIENSDVVVEPANITLADDSMDVVVHITNLGRGTNMPFVVKLTRSFPNGNGDSTYLQTVNGMNYKHDAVFTIPVYHSIAFGANQFQVTVDLENPVVIEQYDEVNNNQVNFTYNIAGNSIFPVYPYEFAIVPDSAITLSASTVNPLATSMAYRFEIDTTDEFNSPIKRYVVVNSVGGVVSVPNTSWLLQSSGAISPLIHTDSTVYFWRVSPDSSVYIWQESSYQYIKGKSGWGQAHFFQFEKDNHTHLNYNRSLRKWEFETLNEIVRADVYSFPVPGPQSFANAWYINGDRQEYDSQGGEANFFVGVIDPYEEDAWKTFDGDGCAGTHTNVRNYGQYNLRPITGQGRCRGEFYFGFHQNDPAQLDSLIDMVENDIPCGHYYVIYTYSHADFNEWNLHSNEMYSFFQNLGVTGLDTGMVNVPLIVMGRKCDTASTKFLIGTPGDTGLVSLSDTIAGVLPGIMSSVKIGPAYEWNTLYWKQHPMESPITGDSTVLSIYGIKHDGTETKIIDTTFSLYDSILNLNSIVDASIYPYMRLRALTEDKITLTPAWFERWQVIYQQAPEAALNPQDGYYFSLGASSIEEGDDFKFAMAIKNISPIDMDSLLVHYWIEDQYHVRHYLTYSRQDSLKVGELLLDTITIPTGNYPGSNFLWIEANPVPLASTTGAYDQLEQYHFNNIARIPFTVTEDNENPILDVTFDGRHILNGDIVSAKPFILISLDDENQYLLMNEVSDTSRFLVYLTNHLGVENRVYFNQGGNEVLRFVPAGSDNKCKIEWNATFADDGIYQIRVKAWDKNDNQSSNKQEGMKVRFEVINKQTITHVMNYPNPFSTKTHFVFTLTGSEAPEYMKIQIFNVSGKVVREITTDEIGPVYVGKNVTEYAWDGKDEFGDQLANGVYFYRVFSKNTSLEDIERRESGADQFFRKGFGKMYLMR